MISRIKQIISKQKSKSKQSKKDIYEAEHEEVVQRMKLVIDNIASD